MLGKYLGAGSAITKLLLYLEGNSNDDSGNAHNGTDYNVLYNLLYGKHGQGVRFDGVGDYIVFGNSSDFDPGSGDFTIDFMFKDNGSSSSAGIFSRSSTTPYSPIVIVPVPADGTLHLYVCNSDGTNWLNPPYGSFFGGYDTNWHRYTLTRSGNTWRGFRDGVKISEVTQSSAVRAGGTLALGLHNSIYLNGYIDDFSFNKFAITPEQLRRMVTFSRGMF